MKSQKLFLLFILALSLVLPGCGGGGGSSAGPVPTPTPVPTATPSPTPAPTPPPGIRGAVLVGVNQYLDPSMNLPECKPDAVDTKSALAGSILWGASGNNITVLTDTQPTKAAIRNAILAHQGLYGPNDLFLLVFSSHGTNDGTTGYVIPYDGTDTNSYISGDELKSWLTALRKTGEYTNICVIIDSCFSGLFIGKAPAGRTSKFVRIPGSRLDFKGDNPAKQIQEMPDAVAITAAAGNEESLTAPSLGHSLCMHYLITGLGPGSTIGPADINHDGKITMTELYNYAYPLVVQYASQIPWEQHPQFNKGASVVELIKM